MKSYITEGIGAFFLTLTVALAGSSDLAPLAIGGVLMILVYAGGYISGGHYNPAVSLAASLSRGMNQGTYKLYVIAQIIGATLAALVAHGFTGNVFAPAPASGEILFAPFFAEVLFTFALCYVVLHVALSKAAKNNQYYGLAIGGTLMVAAVAAGPISGAVLNPAIGIGAFIASLGSKTMMSLPAVLLYVAAPTVGAVLASAVFGMQRD